VCVDPALDAHANRAGLNVYVAWLESRVPSLVAAVRFEQHPAGSARVVTEVHAGGDPDALLTVYEAEVVAHQRARQEGGTASFIFDVFDLDREEVGPEGPSYESLFQATPVSRRR